MLVRLSSLRGYLPTSCCCFPIPRTVKDSLGTLPFIEGKWTSFGVGVFHGILILSSISCCLIFGLLSTVVMAVWNSRLYFPGHLGPFGFLFLEAPMAGGNCQDLIIQCISTALHSRLLMEQTQLEKKVDMQRQETKELLDEWDQLIHVFEQMKVFCKDLKEEINYQQTQIQQVGIGRWVRLRSGTICPFDCLSAQTAICASTHPFTHACSHPATYLLPPGCSLQCSCTSTSGKKLSSSEKLNYWQAIPSTLLEAAVQCRRWADYLSYTCMSS